MHSLIKISQVNQFLMEQNRINKNIETARTNTDKDYQYSAAEDLCKDLLSYYQSNRVGDDQNDLIVNIFKTYHHQLRSEHNDVQANAMKCIQTLAPFMRKHEVQVLATLLLESLIREITKAREFYYITLSQLVDKVQVEVQIFPELLNPIVQNIRLKQDTVQELERSKQIVHQEIQHAVQIQIELLGLCTQIMSRWPKLCKVNIANMLLKNILNNPESSIRKNSTTCLGVLGMCLEDAELNNLIQREILPLIKQQNYNNAGYKQCYHINQGLNYLAKSSGKHFNITVINEIFTIFKATLQLSQTVDIDLVGQYSEILEFQIYTVIYLQENKSMRQYDVELIDLIKPFINYDPLNVAIVDDQPYEDEYFVDDTQDTTWRVRRAAIKVYHELIKVQASNYKQIMAACFDQDEIILTRLDEKNQDLRSAIVQFLIVLVQASALHPTGQQSENEMEIESLNLIRQRSLTISIEDVINKLLHKIFAIFENIGEQQQLKSECTKLLLTISSYFQGQIIVHKECFRQVAEIGNQCLSTNNTAYTNDQKITMLLIFKILSKITKIEPFHQGILSSIFNSVLAGVNQKYIRIVVEAYNTLDSIVNTIVKDFTPSQFETQFTTFRDDLVEKVKVDNLDQEVKIQIFRCLTRLFEKLPQIFSNDHVDLIVKTSIQRLQLDQLQQPVLQLVQFLPRLSDANNLASACIEIMNKQDKNKNQVYISLAHLIQCNRIKPEVAQFILQQFRGFNHENYDAQISLMLMLVKELQVVLPEELIKDAIKVGCQQSKISEKAEEFFFSINQNQVVMSTLEKLNLNKEDLHAGGQILAAVLRGDPKNIKTLYSTLNDSRALKLSALRFLHRKYPSEEFVPKLCELIKNKEDADLAALALGSAIKQLGKLQALIEQNQKQYLYIYALKEFVEINGGTNELCLKLLDIVKDQERMVVTCVGDILGILLPKIPKLETLIMQKLRDPNTSVKLACVLSLRMSNQWFQDADRLLELLEQEKDLNILTGTIKALAQVVDKVQIGNLLGALKFTLTRFEERELHFGNFIERRDEAKDLRSLSFDLLEQALGKQFMDLRNTIILALEKFEEDKFDETRIPRLRLLNKLGHLDNVLLRQYSSQIASAFTGIMNSFQMQLSRKDQNLEKEQEKIRLVVSTLELLRGSQAIDQFYEKYVTNDVQEFLKKQ